MTPYALVLTQRKQFCTISYAPPDVADAPNRLIWLVDTVELDGRVKTKLFRAVRENFLGGTASQNQGAMYAAPIEDVAHQIKSVLGQDVRSLHRHAVDETYVRAKAIHDAIPEGPSQGYSIGQAIGKGIGWACIAAGLTIWYLLKLCLWLLFFPIVITMFKGHRK